MAAVRVRTAGSAVDPVIGAAARMDAAGAAKVVVEVARVVQAAPPGWVGCRRCFRRA